VRDAALALLVQSAEQGRFSFLRDNNRDAFNSLLELIFVEGTL